MLAYLLERLSATYKKPWSYQNKRKKAFFNTGKYSTMSVDQRHFNENPSQVQVLYHASVLNPFKRLKLKVTIKKEWWQSQHGKGGGHPATCELGAARRRHVGSTYRSVRISGNHGDYETSCLSCHVDEHCYDFQALNPYRVAMTIPSSCGCGALCGALQKVNLGTRTKDNP